jgi:electron transfer flavoprotein alpha subunit
MLFSRLGRVAAPLRSLSNLQNARFASTLVLLEHRAGALNPGTLNAITAAGKLGGDVTGVVVGGEGEGVDEVAQASQKCVVCCVVSLSALTGLAFRLQPLSKIITLTSSSLSHCLAEPVAPLLADLVKKQSFTHVVAAHTALGKNIFPRLAALLDTAQVRLWRSSLLSMYSNDCFPGL